MCSMEFYTSTLMRTSTFQLQSHPGKVILMGHLNRGGLCSSVWTFVLFPHVLHLQKKGCYSPYLGAHTVASSVIHSRSAAL